MRLMLAFAALLMAAAPAAAQSSPAVAAAKAAGQVGERYDGYLGYAVTPTGELRRQVDAINIRRRALYSRLGASKGVAPQDVGVTAGCSLLATVRVGEAYLLSDNRWRRRGAGEGPPIPDYCRP